LLELTDIETMQVIFFNKSQEELIRSIFHNRMNDSVIVVSVTKRDDYNSLKCRTVSCKLIADAFMRPIKKQTNPEEDGPTYFMSGKFKGAKLFKDFSLRWPDFIEFDEINQKIITKHS
jgi:hypothetical protein